MRKVLSMIIIFFIVGCSTPKSKEYYREIMAQNFDCDFSADFTVLEHNKSSWISSYRETFILYYSEEDLFSILDCIGTENLEQVPGGFSIMFEFDNHERLWFVIDTVKSTIEYDFVET